MKERTVLHYENNITRNHLLFHVCFIQDGNKYGFQAFYELVLQ